VSGYNYLKSVIHKEHRINLQGEICGTITDKERNYAQKRWNSLHGGSNHQQDANSIKNAIIPKNRPRLSLNKKTQSVNLKSDQLITNGIEEC
tara:strand:- start:5 stop:280 length:276 start_codon:yes stop_codon:yes gene_type:complete